MTETLKESEDYAASNDLAISVSAPSREEEGQPVVARNLGLIGILALALGTVLYGWNLYENAEVPRFNPTLLRWWWLAGLVLTLMHAVRDRARAVRRGYGFAGYVLALFGSILLLLPTLNVWTGNLVAAEIVTGVVGLLLASTTVMPFVRQEVNDEGKWLVARWWQGLATSSLVQKVSVASLVVLIALLAAGYALRQAEVMYYGLGTLLLGLVLLATFAGHETRATWRNAGVYFVGGVGLWAATGGFSSVFTDWVGLGETVLPYGLIFGTVGLVFLWIFVVLQGSESDLGYRTAWAFAIAGTALLLVTVARIIIPALEFPTPSQRVPSGFLLCTLGGLYAVVGAALASDNRLLAMTRRELAAYFYSPIAYVVIAGIALVAWVAYYLWISRLVETADFMGGQPVPEPIVRWYLFAFFPVLALVFFVPAVTMRLLSDEKRSGTLEVLLTAPVDEWSVVLSKFIAAWIFFMLAWLVWGIFPIVLRVMGKEEFDYRPLLSFYLGMGFMSAGFIAMGMFFSSLTRNQIIAFILGVAGMVALTVPAFILWMVMDSAGAGTENKMKLLKSFSYLHHMDELILGKVHLDYLIYHASAALFWIFLSVKVLEARKWS
jgi:ABC-type transport system involved in multi-copper enzyme maturation permease subunit